MISGLDLQVGPGTFKPVEVDDPARHKMHPERYEIAARLAALVELTRGQGGTCGRWAPPWCGRSRVPRRETDGSRAAPRRPRSSSPPATSSGVVDRLITNFHLPRSTLLMLVSAFAGHDLTMAAYRARRRRAVPLSTRTATRWSSCSIRCSNSGSTPSEGARAGRARWSCRTATCRRRPSCRSARTASCAA